MNKSKIAIVGLGYVGLPLLLEFGKKYNVVGYDINKKKIENLKKGIDETLILSGKESNKLKRLELSCDEKDIKQCNIYIITVPTPLNKKNKPDLSLIKNASKVVGRLLHRKDLVIYESTVYPGVTEEICVPILEKNSKLKYENSQENVNHRNVFYCGYSPERINHGDNKHNIKNVKKVVSGSSKKIANKINKLYKSIIPAGTHLASSIKVAEAAKIIENTQRDVNIALINELSIIFSKLNINTEQVLEAASTKWNFIRFNPGLVGGHCIGVDPYYLTYKSKKIGYTPKMILAGRKLNDNMSNYVSKQIIHLMKKKRIKLHNSKILILGLTYKENIADTRNTKVMDLIIKLKKIRSKIDVYDPWVKKEKFVNEKNFKLMNKLKYRKKYDVLIYAVGHKQFNQINIPKIKSLLKARNIIYDLKYILPASIVDGRL